MKAKKTSSVFSFSLWLGFREKEKGKCCLFGNKWYPSTAVSPNKTKQFTQKHGTAPSTGLSTPWHINHDHYPYGQDRACFCLVSLRLPCIRSHFTCQTWHFHFQLMILSASLITWCASRLTFWANIVFFMHLSNYLSGLFIPLQFVIQI